MATLYIVATPIGNLEDITLRAIRILKEVAVVFCEDTRTSRVLFSKYDIKTPTESFHAQSPLSKIDRVIELLKEGKDIALVTDAGTPGISDPGMVLVSEVRSRAPEVIVAAVPGPSALTAAVSIAGKPLHEFVFLGFLPHKKGRQTLFDEIRAGERPYVFYESPHRIEKTLESLKGMPKTVTILRELTKMHESYVSGTAEEVLASFRNNPGTLRGEFVVIVS
ncbi:MAG: 16S rRNA (cytidine(1402)-2'-O)-methyltransferase [Patescibacteria group bacterium]|nr:16S rRNA (cytidine(1402)-2'-O)-methyltransferase [Patescibacteria group bacterium]MDE2116648.1 16S rRNA (cytidine(1402)-2'-O)-methyltransferase [Patescibacteria group bacterium]